MEISDLSKGKERVSTIKRKKRKKEKGAKKERKSEEREIGGKSFAAPYLI